MNGFVLVVFKEYLVFYMASKVIIQIFSLSLVQPHHSLAAHFRSVESYCIYLFSIQYKSGYSKSSYCFVFYKVKTRKYVVLFLVFILYFGPLRIVLHIGTLLFVTH